MTLLKFRGVDLIVKKFLSAVLMLVILVTVAGCSNEKAEEKYVAKVNSEQISLTDYEKNLAIFKKQIEATVGADIWTQDAGEGRTYNDLFREQILEKMIEEEVIIQDAESKGLSVSDEEVETQFANFKEQVKNLPDYDQYLKDNNISDDFIKMQLRKDALIKVSKEHFLSENPVEEADALAYYEENESEFKSEEVEASHILIKTVDDNFVSLSEEEIAEARTLAEDLLSRARAGEDFSELALTYSEDFASAQNGGDLGYFKRGVMVKDFEDMAFSMEEGQISDLVETQYGFHIIKVTGKRVESSEFESVKDMILSRISEQRYTEYVMALKDSAEIEKNEEAFKTQD